MDHGDMTDQTSAACSQQLFCNQDLTVTESGSGSQQLNVHVMSSSDSKWHSSSTEGTDLVITEEGLSNGTCEVETMVASHCVSDSGNGAAMGDHLALSNDGMSEISNSDLSLPEVCISTNSTSFEEDMNYEVQQAYRIFTGFLLDKHKGITSPFFHPIGHLEAQHGIGGVRGWGQAQLRQSMCLRRMEEKFVSQEYETITEFVADFRLMLENSYRYHGVDHWISKQAQKLEIMLEQKLTLLSRTLREKTTLAVTSKGRFGAEEERGSGGTSTRRRSAPRSLATITVGGHESIMVQTLRLEEQQRAKEEKRQRELEKKEAEEMSAKEVEEWEQSMLSQASLHPVDTLWELPAIGHFLCLAQTALNLPEIIFFELERCLLMPRCSLFLSKIMSSLLSPPQKRATLHRRPALPYRRWESELRQRVLGWYLAVGASRDQPGRAEQLGLCHQFFSILGEVSPLDEMPFHLLHFYQRVWLLKGLCDNVYETQKDVQDAVLAQPIHECRESILGYDSMENAYIHFPHFCGADLRIYCQSPSTPPAFPFPPVWVKRIEIEPGTEGEESDGMKNEGEKNERGCYGVSMETGESEGCGNERAEKYRVFKRENGDREEKNEGFNTWSLKEEESASGSSDEGDSSEDSKSNLKTHINSSLSHLKSSIGGSGGRINLKEETAGLEHQSKRLTLKQELGFSMDSGRTIKAETQEPCLSVGEHSYTGRSPARSKNVASPARVAEVKMEGGSPTQGHQVSSCLECSRSNTGNVKYLQHDCCCGTSGLATQLSSESTQNSSEERANDRIRTKKKKRKKKREREQLLGVKGEHRQLRRADRTRLYQTQAAKSTVRRAAATIKRKDKRKKHKTGKKLESSKKIKDDPPVEPSFKLVCTSLEELRELISKTEDELDDLESTKKRLGRWYFRREAVKDLHITLIRLLNELSPWEPKLVKAYQRNRLRLKKEFDDFKKHPDYNNFVREECVSSASDDEESDVGKEACSLLDHYRKAEEEDLEHAVPRGLWTGGSTRQFVVESVGGTMGTYVTPNRLKHPLGSTVEDHSLLTRGQTGIDNITSTPDSGIEPRSEVDRTNQSRDSNSARAAAVPAQASLGHRPTILHPTIGLPKGYTPIPTLLAKSVGNKVTLMKRPADYLGVSSLVGQSKGQVVSTSTSAVANTKPPQAQSSPSNTQQNSKQMQTRGPQQTQVLKQPVATMTAALPKPPQAKLTQMAVPKSPVQVVYKVPEGLGHLLRKDSSSSVKISVQPIVDQSTGEKIMQQVVILPSNLLIQKTEEKVSSQHQQQQSKSIQAPVSKVPRPLCVSTNVPGFTIPDNRIPVQQVAPLNEARTLRTPSPSVSPRLQKGSLNSASVKAAQACSPQTSTLQSVMPNHSPTTTPASAVSGDPVKPTNPKQELKTVCIRDSQSILVTTRGGNTGIVKVQTSSDQNTLGSLPTNPVITISPQFKAFLVSKTSPPLSPTAPSQTSSCTVPAVTSISPARPQNQAPSVLKSSSTVTAPKLTAATGSIPPAGLGSQTVGTTITLSQGYNISPGSIVATKSGQATQTVAASPHLQASLVKSTVIVPSLSGSGIPQVPTQAQFINKSGVKRTSTDERSQVTKFILVTPSSSSSSSLNAAVPKVTSSSATSLSGSRVMFISQPTAASSTTTSTGSIPKQLLATGASGQSLTTSLSSEALKIGLSLGQPVGSVNSEALSNVKNITLPSGVQIQLSGRTTSLGQTIGALSHAPSKSTPVSVSETGPLAATSTGLVLVKSSNMVTSSPAQVASPSPLTTSSAVQGISSCTMVPLPSSPTSTVVTPPAGCIIRKDLGLTRGLLSSNPPAQVTTTAQSGPAQTTTSTLVHQSPNCLSGMGTEPPPIIPSSQLGPVVTQTPASLVKPTSITGNTNPFSATTTTTPSATSATGTIQQRIVINTTTPLAAGTQILLNNARFVVPSQGLGPGSHVFIISSPIPQQVPTTSTTTSAAPAAPGGDSLATVVPPAPAIPRSPPARLLGVPALSSPVVACTPSVGSPVLATTTSVTPVRLAGTSALGSPLLPSTTNVASALPRLPASQAGNLASPVLGTPNLVSAPPRLSSTPALVSPVMTSAPALGLALATVRLPAGTPTLSQCSPGISTLSPALSPPLPPLSSPVLPSTSAVSLPSPVMPALAPLPSAIAQPSAVLAGIPSLPSIPLSQQVVSMATLGPGIQPQQTALRILAPSTTTPQASLHTGLDNTSIKQQVATVMHPMLAGTRTQVLQTVAAPPIGSMISRMQSLPVATVPPIGNVSSFQASHLTTTSPSSSTVIMTPAQPIRALKTKETIHPPVLTNQALGKPSRQNSASGMHTNVASKLLVSPDGAVLSTVQCLVNPAGLPACPKPMATLVVSPSSSAGALPSPHTNNSPQQPSQADTGEPMN